MIEMNEKTKTSIRKKKNRSLIRHPNRKKMTNQTFPNLNIHNENDRIEIVRHHFEQKGYRVHSGLQFGCELVLYADDPDRVHSDFCVHIVPSRK